MAKVIPASSALAFGQNPFLNAGKALFNQLSGSALGAAVKTSVHDVAHDVGALTGKQLSAVNSPGIVLGGSGGSSAGSAGSSSGSSGAFEVKNGKVQFTDKNLQSAMTMINQQAQANNEWNAQQAQKQMDFQKMMSDTAHQREVADLQAAGLNPVLSSGGSGAQAMSGASASADDSNTRLIGELAAAAIEAVQNTAVGVSGAVAAGSRSSSLLKNPYVNAFMKSGASVAGAIGARALLGAVGL